MVDISPTLIAVQSAATVDALQNRTGDETFKKRREWLKANRPNLSEQVERAVSEVLSRFETMDERFPEYRSHHFPAGPVSFGSG